MRQRKKDGDVAEPEQSSTGKSFYTQAAERRVEKVLR